MMTKHCAINLRNSNCAVKTIIKIVLNLLNKRGSFSCLSISDLRQRGLLFLSAIVQSVKFCICQQNEDMYEILPYLKIYVKTA